jgi:hypothetical protein
MHDIPENDKILNVLEAINKTQWFGGSKMIKVRFYCQKLATLFQIK